MVKSGVYCIRNILDNKRYIGSAINLTKRWELHWKSLCLGNHHSVHLQRAWNLYGQRNFVFEILETLEKDVNESKVDLKKRLVKEKEQN